MSSGLERCLELVRKVKLHGEKQCLVGKVSVYLSVREFGADETF